MKYYVYISDTKVDMLYSQIPQRVRDKIAKELKIDPKLISASFKEDVPTETRYSKLNVVVDFIEKNLEVGTVDHPGTYFKGNYPMRWGPYGGGKLAIGNVEPKIVYFGGVTKKTIFGLGGSLHHIIGGENGKSPTHFSSSTPHLVSALTEDLQLSDNTWLDFHKQFQQKYDSSIEKLRGLTDEELKALALIAVGNASEHMTGPKQQLEFLAKNLLCGKVSVPLGHPNAVKKTYLLGSPIYVALVD